MQNISKKLFSGLLVIVLLVSCDNINPFKRSTNKVRTKETLSYHADPEKEVVNFNSSDGSTVVMMGKYLPDHPDYRFIYELKNGVWIGSNVNFRLGDTLTLNQLYFLINEVPTVKGNPTKLKKD